MYPTGHELIAAVGLDLLIGDPRWMPHPVRWMGRLIAGVERVCFPLFGPGRRRLAGAVLVLVVLGTSVGLSVLLVLAAHGAVRFAAITYVVSSLLALTSLDREARAVIQAVREAHLVLARERLARIVGRDTEDLDEPEILRAVFETVAENLSDGVIAPVFYLMLAGVPGMVAYKCVNTLDSMVGYRNDRYVQFGWAAARLDDVMNVVPARVSAVLVVLVAAASGLDTRGACRAIRRDAWRQPSPNAGYPEAAVAGALGVRLGGANRYFGQVVHKPFLGECRRPLSPQQYPSVRGLLYGSALVTYAAAAAEFYWLAAHA